MIYKTKAINRAYVGDAEDIEITSLTIPSDSLSASSRQHFLLQSFVNLGSSLHIPVVFSSSH